MSQSSGSLAEKIREAENKLKQLEADLYFIQGYLKALQEMQADENEAANEKAGS